MRLMRRASRRLAVLAGFVCLALSIVSAPALAARYVNAASGADTGGCAVQASPCKTITYAMTQAEAGDAIQVAPGNYGTALGETFPIVVKSGVHLKSTATAADTILDASGATKRVLNLLGTNAATVVEGFTIMGGAPAATYGQANLAGGMLIEGGAPKIRKNIFVNNQVRGFDAGTDLITGGAARGGGIFVLAAAPTIANNIFRSNVARGGLGSVGTVTGPGGPGEGGGIYLENTVATLNNNTFYANQALGGDGGSGYYAGAGGGPGKAGGIHAHCREICVWAPTINNNMLVNNAADGGRGGGGTSGQNPGARGAASHGAIYTFYSYALLEISNNLFYNNLVNGAASTGDTIGAASVCYGTPCSSGTGFHGEPSNLRITPQSPAAGAGLATGAPGDDFAGATRVNPPSIGAYEPSAATNPTRVVNVSTRLLALTGDNVMIGGFIIGGSTPKTVAVRARGPSLAAQNVPGTLADPLLQLFSGSTQVAANDNWGDAANASQIESSGFAPPHAAESAILITLNPGAYTAIVSGAGGGTGVGIAEIFEVDALTTPLINIATRGFVQQGDNAMIAGFIIWGDEAQTVVVRARGPSLSQFNVPGRLANPMLELYSGQALIASNDDWQSAANVAQIRSTGFAPPYAEESVILVTLQPGAYTAIVRGVGGATGVAIVEVFKN